MTISETKKNTMELTPICHIVAPVGCMGYGFDENLVALELAQLAPSNIPTAIILDAGSTDSGPEKLALGTMTCPRSSYVKDLTKLLRLVHNFQVPLIFGSAGGDGADEHVRLMEDIIKEISAEETNG
ncbi:CaiB/BaiF family enzyme [Colletotrichum tofieldiae]|nr:CaiB/BaiF family enzyme [Colletotrichum tofieldiae]GKT80383.1 CaiB/BaiF family enzyme [Colletotrichum tofieldiae]